MAAADPGRIGERRAEIYTYESQNPVYALNWSVSSPARPNVVHQGTTLRQEANSQGTCAVQNRRDKKFRLAVGSFIEEYENYVEIITRAPPCMTSVV